MKDDKESMDLQQQLSASDADLVRVLEDLIDVLISNGTIRLTDLPPKALEKLMSRKQARRKLNTSLHLINDDEGSII